MIKALGLMSGTSMDGIDVALLESDGDGELRPGVGLTIPYDDDMRGRLREAIQACAHAHLSRIDKSIYKALESALTDLHERAVKRYCEAQNIDLRTIDVIGFHGHTLLHRPQEKFTWQIGDGRALAKSLKCTVVYDFRGADVLAGGEGAPLAPVYHKALASSLNMELPAMFLNLGGVANITWIGRRRDDLIAFDTGPGNALLDDWVKKHSGLSHDEGGRIADKGQVDQDQILAMSAREFFLRKPPKSLDRQDFSISELDDLSLEDGAATLTSFTAECVARGLKHLPILPETCLVVGGGRHNPVLMRFLEGQTGLKMASIDDFNVNGDFIEAHAFAYMAIRRLRDRPISYPGTTGVPGAMLGGLIAQSVPSSARRSK